MQLETLYDNVFELEGKKDFEKASKVRGLVENMLSGIEVTEDDLLIALGKKVVEQVEVAEVLKEEAQDAVIAVVEKEEEIPEIVEEVQQTQDLIKEDADVRYFFELLKDKKFVKNIRDLTEGVEVNDLQLALTLSSYVTHALIEMDRNDAHVYTSLGISEMSQFLADFLRGDIASSKVANTITTMFGDYV